MSKYPFFARKFFILLFFFVSALYNAASQNVERIEYFVDTDPGFGNALMVPITQGQKDVTADFQFDITSLSPGFHNLYIRSLVTPHQVTENGNLVNKGGWSLTNVRTFYKENLQHAVMPNITAGEYFIDIDPGFGSGNPITINTPNNNIDNLSFAFDITLLSPGFHNLYVRFKDANGKWSTSNVRSFYKDMVNGNNNPLPNITKGEYFFDTDPGFGNGVNLVVGTGSDQTNLNYFIDISGVGITPGFHNLYVRFVDANGIWSQTNVRSFYKDNIAGTGNTLPNIVGGEFFIDADPGFGSGLPITINSPEPM